MPQERYCYIFRKDGDFVSVHISDKGLEHLAGSPKIFSLLSLVDGRIKVKENPESYRVSYYKDSLSMEWDIANSEEPVRWAESQNQR